MTNEKRNKTEIDSFQELIKKKQKSLEINEIFISQVFDSNYLLKILILKRIFYATYTNLRYFYLHH